MDQPGIIRDLLFWLDNNLEKPLSLDNVAAKSGYSKWHLQRMFKYVTGQAIGTYIRKRRLTKAAIALRMTNQPILEIALQYHFDSQQTFTRAFKRQYQLTPAYYRRLKNWDTSGLCPPIDLSTQKQFDITFVTLPKRTLFGLTREYSSTLEELAQTHFRLCREYWFDYLVDINKLPTKLYGLHNIIPSKKNDDEQNVFYTTAIDKNDVSEKIKGEPITIEETHYVQFSYKGPVSGYPNFVIKMYSSILPKLQLIITNSYRLEIFHSQADWRNKKRDDDITNDILTIDYLIPIMQIPASL